MKLKAETADESLEIELKRDGDRLAARVGVREYHLEFSEPEDGVFLLKNDGRIYEAAVSNGVDGQTQVRVRDSEFAVSITDPKRLRGSSGSSEHAGGLAEIKTAMPGKVVRILVSPGDAVKKGEGVIVVEAMKMQNEMKSPKDGTITEIKVAEGDTVGAGDVLVVIE